MFLGAGQPVDAYVQPPPGPWDIPATPPSFFSDGKKVIKVPYTSSFKVNDEVLDGGRCHCGHICFLVLLMSNVSHAALPHLCGNGTETLQRLCRVWKCKSFPSLLYKTEVLTLIIPLLFLAPNRKFAGCAMALVSATEVIAAITAAAEAEKSE